ncbi:MAG: alpha-glucan family phosphorylase [candidate division Zixibacteria bacterium]|nr:alpha-glucan family phosphorylase [candidate division Zixibacteria bacterium]
MPKSYDTFRVRAILPDELAILEELSYNLHWTWNHETIELFRRLDGDLWNAVYHNPVKMLGLIKQDRLSQIINDEGFMDQLKRVYNNLQEHLTGKTWFEKKYEKFESPKIAYFSMEFGLTECLPIYSGGLGILAGDHLKSASELGLPLAGVGLLYQQGYFQQYLNTDGWQQETYPDNDFYNLPIHIETDENGKPVLVEVPFPGRTVYAKIWRAQVGRIPLYLLDTNIPQNNQDDRKITYQLYGGDDETRIQQELVLGIGGMRALRSLNIHTPVCHMNEGHAAFIAFERLNHRKIKDGLSTQEALEIVRGGTFFTTHTPVPAGIDEFHHSLIDKYLGHILDSAGINRDEFLGLGRRNPQDRSEPFNMALLALRTTASANGVSRLHGQVSRKMWQSNWPNVPEDEVPIGYVTNGIHTRSWTSPEMTELFRRYLGSKWLKKPVDESIWKKVERIPDVELWRVHERRRERLVSFTRNRLAEQLKNRGANIREIDRAYEVLNAEALTIGFARRFATYKRATLLLRDIDRLKRLLTNSKRPVQFIFAGKAHPRDNGGKELIKQLVHISRQNEIRNHIVFLENYDINVARYLVEGVDIWMNTPKRPMEASGTSGMKVIPNGGLNLSVLDGWWCEGYDTDTGWAIGAGEDYDDPFYQDEVESKGLYDVLENEIIPLFYDRNGNDTPPRGWISMMKKSMVKLGLAFSTNRMVREYTEKFYMKANNNWEMLSSDEHSLTKKLVQWKNHIISNWDQVQIEQARILSDNAEVGVALKVEIKVYLGVLTSEDVRVQIYSGPAGVDRDIHESVIEDVKCVDSSQEGWYTYEGYIACDESGLFGYSVRILPGHPNLIDNFDLQMMRWIGDNITKPTVKENTYSKNVGVV